MLAPVEDYPLIDGAGRRDSFVGLPAPHRSTHWFSRCAADVSARRSGAHRCPGRRTAGGGVGARHLPAARPHRCRNLPEEHQLSRSARHLALKCSSRSSSPSRHQLSAAELATMFHIYFLLQRGPDIRRRHRELRCRLWNPLRRILVRPGCSVTPRYSVPSRRCGEPRSVSRPYRFGEHLDADAIVLALDAGGLRQVVAASTGLGDEQWRARIRQLRTAPSFVVHRLWLDRPVDSNRPAFLGTAGHKPLDNISVLERYEHEAAGWARRHRGSVVELHCYATGSESSERGRRSRSCTSSTPRPPRRVWSTSGCCVVATARCLRPARSHGVRPSRPRSPGWYWPATESASTCRWR